MSLSVGFTPQEEARFRAYALQKGTDPSKLAKKLLTDSLPSVPSAKPVIDDENASAIAQLEAYLAQEGTSDPDEIRKAEEDLQDFLSNLSRNRIDAGERPLFP
jgi:hypothetical protein